MRWFLLFAGVEALAGTKEPAKASTPKIFSDVLHTEMLREAPKRGCIGHPQIGKS